MVSGKTVVPFKISQIEAPISANEYTATIPFAATTTLRVVKSAQESELEEELVAMKMVEARQKQKETKRKMRIRVLNLRSFSKETVEWK